MKLQFFGYAPSSMPKVRQVIKIVEADGWYFVYQRGSHRHFKHPTKLGKVTVAGPASKDLPIGTFRGILNQAGLSWKANR